MFPFYTPWKHQRTKWQNEDKMTNNASIIGFFCSFGNFGRKFQLEISLYNRCHTFALSCRKNGIHQLNEYLIFITLGWTDVQFIKFCWKCPDLLSEKFLFIGTGLKCSRTIYVVLNAICFDQYSPQKEEFWHGESLLRKKETDFNFPV